VARQFSTGTKFGSEKGKVKNPARIPPRDLAPRGQEISRGRANPFPQKNSLPRRVRISIFNYLDFTRNSFELCPTNTANFHFL